MKSRETPTSTSTMSTTPRISKTVNSNHHNEIGASNKLKNIKHTINQGRQNIGKGITDLLETVKNTSTSSDSSMMMYLSAQDSSRRLEMEDRRREREIEIEERRKDREAEREREREQMECVRDQIQREHDLREQAAIMQREQNQMFMTMMTALMKNKTE